MSYSRVRIFNPSGYQIEELDVPTVRSWVLNLQASAVGRCDFTVPTYDAATGGLNPKLTSATFAYGNLVLIEHRPSVNADGTQNGLLPPWVGIIGTPQDWRYGSVDVTAYSAEKVLAYRPMGFYYLEAPAGGIMAQILTFANNWVTGYGPGVQILPGNIDYGGQHLKTTLTLDAFSEVQHLAKYTNYDWDVTPQLSSSNQLQLFFNWYQKKGINSGQVISNSNLQSSDPLYSEQGDFFNVLLGYSSSWTPSNRVQGLSINAASVAQCGIIAKKQVFSGTDGAAIDVIQSMTDAYLAQHSLPTRTFAPTVLDVDNALSACSCGNLLTIQNDTVGFQNGGIGISGNIRITAAEYDDMTNVCKLAGVLQ